MHGIPPTPCLGSHAIPFPRMIFVPHVFGTEPTQLLLNCCLCRRSLIDFGSATWARNAKGCKTKHRPIFSLWAMGSTDESRGMRGTGPVFRRTLSLEHNIGWIMGCFQHIRAGLCLIQDQIPHNRLLTSGRKKEVGLLKTKRCHCLIGGL